MRKEDHQGKVSKVSASEIEEAIDDSYLDTTFFQKAGESENVHFSSVIKEIEGEDEKTYLVKIRPPLFFLHGLLSNISRALSGIKNTKIMDNEEWLKREVEHFKELYPEMSADYVQHDNAFLMEKIDGEVAKKVLCSSDIEPSKKSEVICEMADALKLLHEKGKYHGEPNTSNCIIDEEGEVYWIDFETQYDESLTDLEKRARDLEQLLLSVLVSFREEGEIGMEDNEIIEIIFDEYGDEDVLSLIKEDTSFPLVGPHRIFQFSSDSLIRFYQAQWNIMDYLGNNWNIDLEGNWDFEFEEVFGLSS